MKQSNEAFTITKEKQRFFSEFKYQADSWNRQRKIVGKAEVTSLGEKSKIYSN